MNVIYHSPSFVKGIQASSIQTRNTSKSLYELYPKSVLLINRHNIFPKIFKPFKRYVFNIKNFFIAVVILKINKNYILYTRDLRFSLLVGIFIKNRVIYEIHHFHNLNHLKKSCSALYKSKIRLSTISEQLQKIIICNSRFKERDIKVIRDSHNFHIKKRDEYFKSIYKKINKNNKKVGYFGSINFHKGSNHLFNIIKNCVDIDFYIYSKDPKPVELKNNCKNLKEFTYLEHKFIQKKMERLDACLIICDNNYKLKEKKWTLSIGTSPLKAFEYLAAGIPIIYTDIPPLREILENKIAIPIDNSSDEFINALKNLRTFINDHKINESYELALQSTYNKRAESIYSFCNNEF